MPTLPPDGCLAQCPFAPVRIVGLIVAAAAVTAAAQQFVEDTDARLPAPTPLEYSEQVDIADIDNDGDLDILFANGSGFASPQQQQVNRLYINNGSGVFADETALRMAGVTGYTRDVEFGDVDNDGDLDCLIVNTFNTQSRLLINDGTGVFNDETGSLLPAANFSGSDADFGDVDDDGDLDILFTNSGTSAFGTGVDRLYINTGGGVYADATDERLPGIAVSESIDCDLVDIDGDLDLDAVMAHRNGSSQLWRNTGGGFYQDITAGNLPADGSGTYSIDPGDINGDGDLDLLVVRGSTERVFDNDGTGHFTDVTGIALPNNPFQDDNDGDFLDIDNDGDLDMAIAHLGFGGERIYVNENGVLTWTTGLITSVTDSSLDIEWADLDNDGDLDIVTANGESGTFRNRIYINSGPADTRPPTFHGVTALDDTADETGPYVVRAAIRDGMTSDNNFYAQQIRLSYKVVPGLVQTIDMTYAGGDIYRAAIPGQPVGSLIHYFVSATDWAGNSADSAVQTFAVTSGVDGDGDFDGDVDLDDVQGYLACFSGPGAAAADFCFPFDLDDDGDVDFADFHLLQVAFTGP